MVMLHFKIEKKTDKKIVEYFGNLEKELLEGKLSWLLENLSCPVRFLFPLRTNTPTNVCKQIYGRKTWL